MDENNQTPPFAQDRAALDAIEVLEIVQDAYPDIAQSERNYRFTQNRIARFLRDRGTEIESDVIREFRVDD